MMKRLLAVLLTLAVGSVSLFAAPASAATLKEDLTFGHISQHKSFYDKYKDLVDYVAREVDKLNGEIEVYQFDVKVEDMAPLVVTLKHTHPELFFVSNRYRYSYYTENGAKMMHTLKLHWGRMEYDKDGYLLTDGSGNPVETLYSDDQVTAMRAEFRRRAQWYLDKVDDNMSEFDKALVLHDELVLHSSYLLTGETYDLMVNGQGRCYGYSECYSYLLAQVGVDSEIVESDDMNHQWNKVKIDGEYYHVDVTWDDPLPDSLGFVKHTFFLLSDEGAASVEADPHYGYESDYPSLNTRFDRMRFHKINTRMCRVGDDLYLVDNKRLTPETAKNLLTYDIDTDSFSLVNSFASEVWTADGGRVWGNGYMSLQEQDGYLYMNTANKVLVYDTETSEMSLFAENTYNKQFFGLCLEDGRLYAVLADSPNETGRLQYVGDCLVRVRPTTIPPTTIEQTTIQPTTIQPTTIQPTTVQPTTIQPTTIQPTTIQPTTIQPTTIQPTTIQPTIQPTTIQPTTIQPTTIQPTTIQPTTIQPTTIQPTTIQPTTVPVRGDIDGDGRVTIGDATWMQFYLAEFSKPDAETEARCDVNGDGRFDVRDVTVVMRIVAEME